MNYLEYKFNEKKTNEELFKEYKSLNFSMLIQLINIIVPALLFFVLCSLKLFNYANIAAIITLFQIYLLIELDNEKQRLKLFKDLKELIENGNKKRKN